jgi:hypothetical protein
MKKEAKFTLEKFQVAKLKNMKSITGGEGNPKPTEDHELTDVLKKLSSNIC